MRIVRWDNERAKWRVDVGVRSHEFVGRYKDRRDAELADAAARKAYALAKKN